MNTIYLTGTLQPGVQLLRFLPDYLDILHHQGHDLITTNKRGVDAAILDHCERRDLPLTVYEFSGPNPTRNRTIATASEAVQVRHVAAPIHRRFRYLADMTRRMTFLHSGKTTRGNPTEAGLYGAFSAACERRGVVGEQLIVQRQGYTWVNAADLSASPLIGAAHVYVAARPAHGVEAAEWHSIGNYRIETWRAYRGIVQPGIGAREVVVPNVDYTHGTVQTLRKALTLLKEARPYKVIIHHALHYLEPMARRDLSDLLAAFPLVEWRKEQADVLRRQIGEPVSQQQSLWDHRKAARNVRGLYQ